jgi:Flp pilus assembly protein TadD
MSRLFDGLARLDRGRPRPAGLGSISIAMPRAEGRRAWRIVGTLIILGSMAAIGMAVYVRPPAARFAAAVPAALPIATPLPAPAMDPALRPIPTKGAPLARGLEAARRGNLADAEQLLREAVARDGGDAEAWNGLGVVLIRQGDREPGLAALRTALRLDPAHGEAHRNLGAALDRLGRRDEAIPHYRAFLALTADGHPGRDEVRRRLAELAREPA